MSTIAQMHIGVKNLLPFNRYDDFEPEEIDLYLNEAIELFVSQKYNDFVDARSQNLAFEEVQKRLDDLRAILITDKELTPIAVNETFNYGVAALPGNYKFLVEDSTLVYYNACSDISYTLDVDKHISTFSNGSEVVVENRLKTSSNFRSNHSIAFKKTSYESPLSRIRGNNLEVYFEPKKFIPKKIYIDYIREPQKVDLSSSKDCDLAPHTHREIIRRTVDVILEVIERRERAIDPQSLQKE